MPLSNPLPMSCVSTTGLRRSAGFTAIELLVTISIIAVLVGVFVPAITQVREALKATVCTSNLRQFGMAFTTYASDWDGFYPMDGNFLPPGWVGNVGWSQRLLPYLTANGNNATDGTAGAANWATVATVNVYWCPSARKNFQVGIPDRHFGINPNVFYGNGCSTWGLWRQRTNRCPQPGRYALLSEMNQNSEGVSYMNAATYSGTRTAGNRVSHFNSGASGKLNVLFADYHVERMTGDISTVASAANWRYWRWW